MTASYGTIKREFSKQWIYLNPNPAEGPWAWHVSNHPPVDDPTIIDEIQNLYTVPPIMNNQVGQTANLYFSIEDLKDRNEPDGRNKNLRSHVAQLLEAGNLPPLSRNGMFDVTDIQGIAPVMSQQNDNDAYLWFDIAGLEPIDTVSRRLRRYKVKALYNSRSVTSLTADEPLFVENVDGLATVSFNITSLPPA